MKKMRLNNVGHLSPLAVIEHVLCGIAMVNIPVHNQNPANTNQQPYIKSDSSFYSTQGLPFHIVLLDGYLGSHGNVVEDTEPHTTTCLCMVARRPVEIRSHDSHVTWPHLPLSFLTSQLQCHSLPVCQVRVQNALLLMVSSQSSVM